MTRVQSSALHKYDTNDVDCLRAATSQRYAFHPFRMLLGFLASRKSQARAYVVRIRRHEHAWTEHEIAILIFLANTNIPAPKISFFSLSSDNPTASPLSVQIRLPGKFAVETYSDLNTQQRVTFARDLGKSIKEMTRLYSPCPDTLEPESVLRTSPDVRYLQLQCPPRNAIRPASGEVFTPAPAQTVNEFLKFQCDRQRQYDISLNRGAINPWRSFVAIIDNLHQTGHFEGVPYALTHMDFEPRNILIEVTSPRTARLSGILDWDEAVFAPAFTGCWPPSWLWDFEGEDDEELHESVAHVTPARPDLAAIKAAFEDAVGPEYLRYAYTPEYRIARTICKLDITGFHSNDEYELATNIIMEWNALVPDFKVSGIFDLGR